MKMKHNPWYLLKTSEEMNINVMLADINHILEFYWAKDSIGNLLFMLKLSNSACIPNRLPKLNGIDIDLNQYQLQQQLIFKLKNVNDIEIFYTLCIDLMRSTGNYTAESKAIEVLFRRLNEWQYFLKNNKKIIDKQQLKGLIGELLFLNNYLLKFYSVPDALTFWKAPLKSIHDFEVNDVTVEVKTKSSVNSIYISGYEQLFSNLEHLVLYVVTLNNSTEKTFNAFNIYTLIEEIKYKIRQNNISNEEAFDNLLMQYGFIELDEYNDYYFLLISDAFYEVTEIFPKISICPDGIEDIKYRVNLDKCKQFLTDNYFKQQGYENGKH